ncbi:MAG: DNA-3-methyladenine glycosylase [Marinifilaceae bacterium]
MMRLDKAFFQRDVLVVAPELLGKILVRRMESGELLRFRICEVEAYRGQEDKACHASKGRTQRTKVMFQEGGFVYVYLIYGMYWLLNFVTGREGEAQAVLIRGVEGINGPGRLGKILNLDNTFYGEDLMDSNRLWVEGDDRKFKYTSSPRIGITTAGEYWKNRPWRFVLS